MACGPYVGTIGSTDGEEALQGFASEGSLDVVC